jgi:hypothetical protein
VAPTIAEELEAFFALRFEEFPQLQKKTVQKKRRQIILRTK